MQSSISNRPTRAQSAFTLIELLVVIIILAILAAVVIPRVIGRTEDARVAKAMTDIATFRSLLETYKADTSTYPTTAQGLQALVTNPGVQGWNGPYIVGGTLPLDPWGHPYIYKSPGDHDPDYDIISAGPDGQPGDSDDIDSWNLQKNSVK